MNCACRFAMAGLLATATLVAQADTSGEGNSAAELSRLEREKAQRARDVENLVDRRMRMDLGLPVDEDPMAPRPQGPVTTEMRDRLQLQWRDEDANTASLAERYNRLKALVDQTLAEAAQHPKAPVINDEAMIVVPQAGTAPAVRKPTPAPKAETEASNDAAKADASASAGGIYSSVDKPKSLIQGSKDHLRVAQALFKAGQRLADEAESARELNRPKEAQDRDQRAQERLKLALEELGPLLQEKDPPYAALFYQGRCLELLFRYSERYEDLSLAQSTANYQRREQEVRDPFLRIAARDVLKGGKSGDVEKLGSWGIAAQAAMDHFKWMNVNGHWRPKVDIASITWPGEDKQ